nr:MAG TPA: hypothetical protein [Caudoviricetes sp.]
MWSPCVILFLLLLLNFTEYLLNVLPRFTAV